MTKSRRRFKQTISLDDRLAAEAARLRLEAAALSPSAERDHLLRQARHAETAAHMNEWLNSPGLQAPS